jgi:phosphatidylglycerol:prolipoprotein diacylglycerol transferase
MLPVLFTLTFPPTLAPFLLFIASMLIGAYQARTAKQAGESNAEALRTGAIWLGGSYAAFFLLVRALGDPGNNNLFALHRALEIPLHTYGLLIATAFLVAMWLAGRAALRAGLDQDRVMDLCFWILVSAMAGSRILFIIVNWDEYAAAPLSVFAFWKGGLVFYGGFIGATVFSIYYMRKHNMEFFPYADALIPSVSIGHAIGRMGCFAAGCCWGGACDPHLAWAARFPVDSLAYQSQLQHGLIHAGSLFTLPIHPTQLYESLGELTIFLVLTLMRPLKRFNGEILALYLLLYAPLRATVEMLRGDEERGRLFNFLGPVARGAIWNLSTSEAISVGIFCIGIAIFAIRGRVQRPVAAVAA